MEGDHVDKYFSCLSRAYRRQSIDHSSRQQSAPWSHAALVHSVVEFAVPGMGNGVIEQSNYAQNPRTVQFHYFGMSRYRKHQHVDSGGKGTSINNNGNDGEKQAAVANIEDARAYVTDTPRRLPLAGRLLVRLR